MALYYISDQAYATLISYGQRQRYITISCDRANGMSKFLEDLSKSNFEDTRPALIKLRHEEEVRHFHHAPTWTSYYARRTRQLTISDESLARYIGIALTFGIIQPEPFAIGGPSRLTMIPTTSLVLEGIGLHWITPVDPPFNRE